MSQRSEMHARILIAVVDAFIAEYKLDPVEALKLASEVVEKQMDIVMNNEDQ